MPNELILFINAIVVALMAMYVYCNDRRLEEISAKFYRTEAQMTLDISKNEKRIGEISAEQKKDQSVVAQMAVQISNIEKRIAELKKEKSEIRPAFTAYFKNGGYMNLGHQNLIFDSVRLNIGQGYNPGTGYFIVPRAGLYLVSCKVRSNHRTHLHVWLRKNDEQIILGYGENYNEGSFSIPVQAAKKDKLDIRHGNTGESVEGGVSSFFSAVFISD